VTNQQLVEAQTSQVTQFAAWLAGVLFLLWIGKTIGEMGAAVVNDALDIAPKTLSGGCASCQAVLINPRACESCGKALTNPNPPAVRLVGIAPRPPRPPEVIEREEEKLERRRRGLRPGTHIELLAPEEEARIHELRAQGLTFLEIAKRIGRSKTAVWRTIHRGRPPLRRAITPERLQEVVRLRRLGLSWGEIGPRLGISRIHVGYLLHRAGERIDPREAGTDLQVRLLTVSDTLRPPAAIAQLAAAANKLQDIYEDAALLLEIAPRIPYVGPQPYDIGFRAVLAEEVLRTGIWCMEQKVRGYWTTEVLVAGRTEERRVEMTAEHRELLGSCGEAARDAGRGIIEDLPGYETKSAQILFLVEEMMEEAKE